MLLGPQPMVPHVYLTSLFSMRLSVLHEMSVCHAPAVVLLGSSIVICRSRREYKVVLRKVHASSSTCATSA